MPARRRSSGLLCVIAFVAVTVLASSSSASVSSAAAMKPVIGKPTTVPTSAAAGRRLTVVFGVTRSDTGAALTTGTATARVSVSGTSVKSGTTLRAGKARVSFLVPTRAAGTAVKVVLTVKAGALSASRTARFPVKSATVAVSIADASNSEGNAGTTTLSFPVTLSASSNQVVTVDYATRDGSATAPADFAASTGTLTFKPGERTKSITVGVVGDLAIEQDESFSVTLSRPMNATIAQGSATGSINNDDTIPPIPAGAYQGATQEGNYVFLTVQPDRTVTGFRVNDLPETCDGPLRITGGVNWTENTFAIRDDGTFRATGSWTGSNVQGDAEWTAWSAELVGTFSGGTVNGTIVVSNELNYKGKHYRCTTGQKTWSATLKG